MTLSSMFCPPAAPPATYVAILRRHDSSAYPPTLLVGPVTAGNLAAATAELERKLAAMLNRGRIEGLDSRGVRYVFALGRFAPFTVSYQVVGVDGRLEPAAGGKRDSGAPTWGIRFIDPPAPRSADAPSEPTLAIDGYDLKGGAR